MQRLAFYGALAAAAAFVSGCENTQPAAVAQLPQVTVAAPLARPVTDWDSYVGQFEAVARVDVRPRVSGHLVDVHFADRSTWPAARP